MSSTPALLTLDQLRAAIDSGGVRSVRLVGQDREFLIVAERRIGGDATLSLTRQRMEPRRFVDATKAALLLRDLGIRQFEVQTKDWRPEQAGT